MKKNTTSVRKRLDKQPSKSQTSARMSTLRSAASHSTQSTLDNNPHPLENEHDKVSSDVDSQNVDRLNEDEDTHSQTVSINFIIYFILLFIRLNFF